MLSVSGALLVFGKEIQHTIWPDYWQVEAQNSPLSVNTLVRSLQQQAEAENSELKQLKIAEKNSIVWTANLANGTQWNIDPFTGRIVHRFTTGQDFYSYILFFHRWLLMDAGPYRDWTRHIISIAALLFILQIIVGVCLWLQPRKRAIKRLKYKTGLPFRPWLNQLHLISGVYAGIFLILIAYTGIGFNWPEVNKLVEWLSFSKVSYPPPPKTAPIGGTNQFGLALKNGQQALPEAELRRIYFPQDKNKPMVLRYKTSGEFHPFSYVWVDGGSGNVLLTHNASKASRATRVWNFKYKFHIGDFAGTPVRFIWLVLSLLPCFFVLSGFYLWWKRNPTHKKRSNVSLIR